MTASLKQLRSRLESERKSLLGELAQLDTNVREAEVGREGSPFGKGGERPQEGLRLRRAWLWRNRQGTTWPKWSTLYANSKKALMALVTFVANL